MRASVVTSTDLSVDQLTLPAVYLFPEAKEILLAFFSFGKYKES